MRDNLHRLICDGDWESVQRLLDAGAYPNARDARGWTPLSRAIERRKPEIALLLIERGADCLATDRRRRTPLHWAAQHGSDAVAEKLLERGADVIAFDDHSNTPLTQASRHGRTSIVQKLLRHERWSDATGRYWKNYRWTESFFLAIHNHHPHTVAAFLDEGQSVDSTTTRWVHSPQRRCYQPTALMEAIVARDLRIVDLLLRRGADLQKKTQRRSALTEALTHYGKDAALTQTLLDRGAILGLEEAIVTDDLALAERLLTDGADTEMSDDYGETLLIWAALQGQSDAVRLLIRFGANPNACGKYSGSALAAAAATGNIAMAKFLIEQRADTNAAIPRWQSSPLTLAARSGQTETMRWFIDRFGLGADQGASALGTAAANNRLEAVRILLNAGVNVNVSTHYYFTRPALTWAAWDGNVAIVRLLLDHGADINAGEVPGHPGRTALQFAAGAGRKRVIPLLIEHGATSEQKDKALLEALRGGHSDTAELLLQGGADPNVVGGYSQETALMLAGKNGKLSVVQRLLDKGAAIDAVDKNGKTARDWAEDAGRIDIAALLGQYAPRPIEP